MKIAVLWAAVLGSLLIGFNNCSQVAFDTSKSELLSQAVEFFRTSEIEIDGGAEYTRSSVVQLKLSAIRAAEMKISNNDTCNDGAWEPFTTAKVWTLTQSNATAAVYAQYKDIRGNITDCVKDDIVHDNIAPSASFVNGLGLITNDPNLNIAWSASDNLSGVKSAVCRGPDNVSSSCMNSFNVLSTADGVKAVAVKVTDKAGNESSEFLYQWIFDKTPPTVSINSRPASLTGSGTANISFTGNDALSGIAGFKCKVGSATASPCSSPLSLSALGQGSHHVEVFSIDKAGNTSSAANVDWVIDMTAPSMSFTTTPPSISGSRAANFAYTGVDDGQPITQFQCQLDAGGYSSCSGTSAFTNLSEGNHSFYVRGIDTAGNMSQPIQYDWLIDTTAPTVTITSGPNALTNLTTANFQWAANDSSSGVKTIECRIDAAAYAACGAAGQNFSSLAAGPHQLDVRATDYAGNSAVATRNWTVDLTPPTVTITSGPAAYVKVTTAQLSFTGADANGISGYECRVDNGGYVGCSSPFTTNALAEGGHSFFVRSIDKAGNASAPASHSWTVDLSPPLIIVTSAPGTLKQGDPAVIEYQVIDPSSGVGSVICGLTMPSNTLATCQEVARIDLGNALNVGTYSFQIKGTDKVGNSLTETVSFEVTARPIICDPFTVGGEAACDGGLIGDIYYLDAANQQAFVAMPNKTVDYFYSKGILVNALLTLKQLFVTTRSFTAGFPMSNTGTLIKDNSGNTLNEYFAFKMRTVLKLDPVNDQAGWYQFATLSDDGSMLLAKPEGATDYTQTIVSNDGDHSTRLGCSTNAIYIADTTRLPMMLKYYQGPRTEIAMTILWRRVPAMNTPLDSICGVVGNNEFFGPPPYTDMNSAYFGQLLAHGWRVVAPANFIAPPR